MSSYSNYFNFLLVVTIWTERCEVCTKTTVRLKYGEFRKFFFFLNTYGIQTKIINLSLKKHFPHLNSKGHFIDDASTSERPSKNSTKVCDGICRKSQQLLVFSFSNMPKNFVDLRTVRAITISGYRFRAL